MAIAQIPDYDDGESSIQFSFLGTYQNTLNNPSTPTALIPLWDSHSIFSGPPSVEFNYESISWTATAAWGIPD